MGNEKTSLGERDSMELTEEELYCIAKQAQMIIVKGILHREDEHLHSFAPCENCKYFAGLMPHELFPDSGISQINCPMKSWYRALRKLSALTGVSIECAIGFKIES